MKFACEASASAVPVCVSGARGGHTPHTEPPLSRPARSGRAPAAARAHGARGMARGLACMVTGACRCPCRSPCVNTSVIAATARHAFSIS